MLPLLALPVRDEGRARGRVAGAARVSDVRDELPGGGCLGGAAHGAQDMNVPGLYFATFTRRHFRIKMYCFMRIFKYSFLHMACVRCFLA